MYWYLKKHIQDQVENVLIKHLKICKTPVFKTPLRGGLLTKHQLNGIFCDVPMKGPEVYPFTCVAYFVVYLISFTGMQSVKKRNTHTHPKSQCSIKTISNLPGKLLKYFRVSPGFLNNWGDAKKSHISPMVEYNFKQFYYKFCCSNEFICVY